MTAQGPNTSPEARGFVAYDRATVDRFFAEARLERARLLSDIAEARRRIARAESALRASAEAEHSIHATLEAQRHLREERRANERAIVAILADADAEVEHILREAKSLR